VVVVFPHRLADTFRVPQIGAQIGRSVMLLLSTVCNFAALIYLPLADVASIVFTAPIIVAVLAVVILGERVSLARWAAIGLGFVGALMIVRPGGSALGIGTLLAFGCALFSSLYQVTTRLVRDSDPVISLLYGGLVGMVIYSCLAPFWWDWPSAFDWLQLILIGVLGAIGHMLLILALQRAEASRISPFTYIQLIWAILASLLVFGDPLSAWTLAGSAVIATSGLFMYRLGTAERKAAEAAAGVETGSTEP
jgi:drug/metabolite transporter (DMT)-like permease